MKKTKASRFSKKQIVLLSVASIAIVLIGLWSWNQFAPRPLGDKLEYIGKRDYGCHWLCGSRPGTKYYYATNLTPPELVAYLQNARATNAEFQVERWQNRGLSFHVDFINENSSERFTFYIYTRPSEIGIESIQTDKQYIVSFNSNYYKIVLDSL